MSRRRGPPYKTAGLLLLIAAALVLALVYVQFRGGFAPTARLTMVAPRAGLVMSKGSRVTYNGAQIGRVAGISAVEHNGKPAAKLVLDVNPKYLQVIPANVVAAIKATTVFGNKYVAFTSPKNPTLQRITPQQVIDATSVTTEFDTLFETITSIAEKVDPIRLNLTLSAVAEALSGLGDRFGQSLVNGNAILDDLNPRLGRFRRDVQRLADLADVYADASPDLWNFLSNLTVPARTIDDQQDNLDSALLAAAGVGDTAADTVAGGGPYLVRGAADLVPSAQLLDEYSPEIYCTIRNYNEIRPKVYAALGGTNGYSLGAKSAGGIVGAPNPYLYPENLPRINARGGPGGKPGCWQTITRELWPAPYLVMDTGASIAPYNHFDIGSPFAVDYIWGRQIGDSTINP